MYFDAIEFGPIDYLAGRDVLHTVAPNCTVYSAG